MITTPSTYDRIYVRTDKQCLFALDCGSTFYIDRDPLLSQTYLAIHLNDRPIYFHDLVANRTLIECPIGMAIYYSHIKQLEDTNELSEFNERCEVFFGWLCDGDGREIVHDGEYAGQPLYVKGQYAIEIVERAGYFDFYDYPLAEYIRMPFAPEKLYFIPSHFVKDELVDLSPSGVQAIVEWNSSLDICNIFSELDPTTGEERLCIFGSDIERSLKAAGFRIDFDIEEDKKYYFPTDLTSDGRARAFKTDDICALVAHNKQNTFPQAQF
jgi:hypothetical protein